MKTLDDFKAGITLGSPEHPVLTEEWLFDEKNSTENKLILLGYDVNLFPFPCFSRREELNPKYAKEIKERLIEATKDFIGEVWIDDVKIKSI